MSEHSRIRLTKPIPSHRKPGYVHGVGTEGIAVEPLGENAWIIEVRVADTTLVGDAWYETLDASGDEFELCEPRSRKRTRPNSVALVLGHELTVDPWSRVPTASEPLAATPEKLVG
jgi:hypothetical protein